MRGRGSRLKEGRELKSHRGIGALLGGVVRLVLPPVVGIVVCGSSDFSRG